MEYNTTRNKLLMPEYGRNVQSMAEHLLTIEDRQKRLQQAEIVIELMGTLSPHLKQIEDYKHKLWDHLYQMTDFRLDVDSPYEQPTPEQVFAKPEPLAYPQQRVRFRHFGKKFEELLQKALDEPDAERRQAFTQALGYYMKLAYANWHKEPVHDDMIKNELAEMTKGQLQFETGGYRVHFNPGSNNTGNRNFKGGNRNNNFNKGGGGGGNRNYGGGGNKGGGGGQNRKFYKNKNK